MNKEQALQRLIQVVSKGAKHPWYERTTELADLYRKLVTGDGLDKLLRQFVQRESKEAFAERVKLTQHVVTTVTKNIMDVFYKVPRSNYQRILEHLGDNSERMTAELGAVMDTFWGVRNLDEYVQTRWLEMNATDPNGFVVVEFKPFDNQRERAKPYPYEVTSHEAVDYKYENNVLQYLTVKTSFPLPVNQKKDKVGDNYALYLQNETLNLQEIDPATVTASLIENQFVPSENGAYLLSNKRVYFLTESIPHNAGRVPAKPVGYLRDAWTNGQTFVSPYDSAVPLLLKSVKVNSELDIVMSQQAFPHRLQYMPICKADGCKSGYLLNGETCGTCKGTGHDSITSAMDVIYFSMPKDAADIIDLEKILVFKGPPIEVVQFQKDYVTDLTAGCKAVVFNSESFSKMQISGTATGELLDRDNVQDTLYSCAKGFADTWGFYVWMTADFADLSKGLSAKLVFSKDFQLKNMSELISDREAAVRGGASPAVIQHIDNDIARLMYSEDPVQYNEWWVKESFNPFSGMGGDMIALALSDPAVPQKYKTRYLMLGVIFSELENEFEGFYQFKKTEQARLIDEKVVAYMNETKPVAPAIALPINTPVSVN